jgi:hypothetical protein
MLARVHCAYEVEFTRRRWVLMVERGSGVMTEGGSWRTEGRE